MIWGTYGDLREAVKRLRHFAPLFKADGKFTALTSFGRNFALFLDVNGTQDYLGDLVLCAGAGKLLADKCDRVRIAERLDIQSEIAAWWYHANDWLDLEILYGLKVASA